jgi:hypothetical protein
MTVELEDKRQELFCRHYAYEAKGNAALAATMAGYSAKSARKQGYRLRTYEYIRRRIAELEMQALKDSGYSPEMVKECIAERLISIIKTKNTDVVNISVSRDDPNREEVIRARALANGGQRELDYGDVLISPTFDMPEHVKAAIKAVNTKTDAKGRFVGLEVEMYDPIAAARTLAQILSIGGADSNVNINLTLPERLEEARRRAVEAKRAHEEGEVVNGQE